ncbi:hypothetical protein JCM5296_003271 [Sporobolomyces johnsonii]
MEEGGVVPLAEAVYCANPDAVSSCIKLCAAADVCSIGVRLGSYLQAVCFLALVIIAPDEGGAESMWLGLSVSFSFIVTCYIQLIMGDITMHHTVVVTLLSHLPYVATMAGMNSLTTYEVLGPAGVRFLQGGLLIKAVLTALLWAMCIFAWAVGQLPSWTHLQFRQANCLESTALTVWFVPVRRTDENKGQSIALLATYSLFWFLVLCAGSYWSLIAPHVLVKRGGHLRDPKKKKIKGFPVPHNDKQRSAEDYLAREKRKTHMQSDPSDYSRDTDEGDDLLEMTMRSMSKPASKPSQPAAATALPLSRTASSTSLRSSGSTKKTPFTTMDRPDSPRSLSPPPATEGMTALSPWSKGLRGTAQEARLRWTKRQNESRHHFIIWPIVAVLLTFTIVTTELQIAMNDVYSGEMALDFPGTLTFFLALPTAWAVIKALNRIREGRRPTPNEREDKTFLEVGAPPLEKKKKASRTD